MSHETSTEQPLDLISALGAYKRALTLNELTALLHVSSKTVFRLSAKRFIPSTRIGGSLRFSPATISRYVRAATTEAA